MSPIHKGNKRSFCPRKLFHGCENPQWNAFSWDILDCFIEVIRKESLVCVRLYSPSKVMSKVVRHRFSGVSRESPYIGLRRFILWQKPDSTCPSILCLAPGMVTTYMKKIIFLIKTYPLVIIIICIRKSS